MRKLFIPILSLSLFLFACDTAKESTQSDTTQTMQEEANPAAEGFDMAGSDKEAIAIADEVMEAMGGRKAYDNTRFISWNFFGARKHIWDKQTGDVRIENPRSGELFLMNINSMKGKAFVHGEEITEADSLGKMMDKAKAAWINDAYWLVMPFKLKDSGVTLTYAGEDTTQSGAAADVLELVFKEVGVTPQNKYQVWVEKEPRLVTQWSYYPTQETAEPRFITPWINYEKHGDILLSGDRGERKLSEISVSQEMDAALFTQP
ncbi:MAG: hypothetical protein AAGD28_27360 [Bacteroidota bacterium]